MAKKFIKKNNKIYEVQEHEVTIANIEYDITQLELQKEALEAEKEAIELLED